MAACHLIRRKSNFPFLGQREYQAKTGESEFATRTQPAAIYVVLKYDRSKKETKIKFKYLRVSSQLCHSLALTFGSLPNILLSGFSSQICGWWQQPQGWLYAYAENKWVTANFKVMHKYKMFSSLLVTRFPLPLIQLIWKPEQLLLLLALRHYLNIWAFLSFKYNILLKITAIASDSCICREITWNIETM